MSELQKKIEALNEEFCVVRIKGKTVVCKQHPQLEFLTVKSFKEWMANQKVLDKGQKPISVADAWFTDPKRRQFEGVDLVPKGAVPAGYLNLYRGWGVTPKQGSWPLMQAHVEHILANWDAKAQAYILRWIAWCLQNPDKRAEVALVLRGDRGAGKGTGGNALCEIFGPHGVHIVDENLLTGRFKGHLLECLFLFVDEAVWGGNRKGAGALQGLITEPTLHIEQKGLDAISMTNRLHIIMAADKDWVVPAGKHERRYAVFEVSNQYSHGNASPADIKAYFDALHDELYKRGGLEAMMWDLQNADLGNWHPRQVYETAALRKQQKLGMSALELWWEDVLEGGRLPHQGLAAHCATTVNLKAHIKEEAPELQNLSYQKLALFLEAQGAISWHKNFGNGWTFLALAEHRKRWEQKYGERQWSEPDACWSEGVKPALSLVK
jgi:Family of unknown function (DUF5906)